jgi:hypothetical protein
MKNLTSPPLRAILRRTFFSIFFLLLSVWARPSRAWAEDFSVAASFGLGLYDVGAEAAYGLSFYYHFSPLWSIGIVNTYANLYSVSTPIALNVGATHYDTAIEYHFVKLPVWAGARLGVRVLGANGALALSDGITFTKAGSTVGFEAGAAGGYDYPLIEHISVGGEVDVLIANIQGIWALDFQILGAVRVRF